MITDLETNKLYLSSLLKVRYSTFWNELERILSRHRIIPSFIDGTSDIWCRDYMPIQVSEFEYVQFKYFPQSFVDYDYIKRLTIQEDLVYEKPNGIKIKNINLFVDGGNIVRSKSKVIMTEKVFEANHSRSKQAIIKTLKNALKVDEIHFIPVQPYDMTGHSDGMVRFLDESTLLVNEFIIESDSWNAKLERVLKQTGLDIIRFPYYYSEEKFEGEWTAKGCYINYAQIGNLILFPQFGINEDGKALSRIKELYPEPDFHVETIDSSLIAKNGGVLNCGTWSILKTITENAIDNIIPVYGDERQMLVVHRDDPKPVRDTICVQLFPAGAIIGASGSLQRTIKRVEPIDVIQMNNVEKHKSMLKYHYTAEQLSDILELLVHPAKDVFKELVEVPLRLRKYKPIN